jgi:protein-tyrosine phosphatase
MLKRLYLRDVGGEITATGQRVRMGLLYRSSGLHQLRSDELAYVRGLGLRHIIDLREASAVTRHPDKVQAETVTLLPMGFAALETVKPRDVLLRRVNVRKIFHAGVYAEMLESHAPSFRVFLDSLLQKPIPALVHCTAGKDRTGMAVAMFYLALGVPSPNIVQSYMAIMPHLKQHFPRRLKALVHLFDGPPLAYSVIPEYMEGMLTHIEKKYGGPDAYFQSIGFVQTEALRQKFLE